VASQATPSEELLWQPACVSKAGMKYELEFKGLESAPDVRRLIESLITRLDRKSQALSDEPLFVRCVVEEVETHKLYRVSLTLEVPQKTLAAKQEMHDAQAAIRRAFEEIETQLEAYKSSLRGEQWWKRVKRRRELKQYKHGAAPSTAMGDESFFALVEPHLAIVREMAGRMLRYAEARGDLPPGDLELDEVVDAALARAYDRFSKERAPGDIRSRLVGFALDEIKTAVKRAKEDRERAVHIEEDVPETPPTEEVSTLGDEILDFYQPDEDLRAEDIIPDLDVPPPEQIAETEELRRCVRSAFRELPRDERRVLTLRYIVRLHGDELARSLRRLESETEGLIESARAHLRQKLATSGCAFKATQPDERQTRLQSTST
jgi:RNA polymerase sigma factor (sigma-70 family)